VFKTPFCNYQSRGVPGPNHIQTPLQQTCASNLSELFNHVHDLNSAVQPRTKQRILLIKYATPLEAGGLCIKRLCAKRDVTCCTDLVCDLSTHSAEEEVHAVEFSVGVFNSADCSPDAGYVLAHHESI
jgi:hypothetical protein